MFQLNFGGAAKGHQLDEPDLPRSFQGQAGQCNRGVIIIAAGYDRIEFNWLEPGYFGGLDAGPGLIKGAPPHYVVNGLLIQ